MLTEDKDMAMEQETSVPEQDIVDIAIPEIRKQRFRINGSKQILELNTSDMGIISRLEKTYSKLDKLAQEASAELSESVTDTSSEDEFQEIVKASNTLQKIDKKMRGLVDEIFDAPVSEVAVPSGTMFDLFNGEFRYEHIIKAISGLYEKNLAKEFDKVSTRMKRHTKKYTGK